MPSEIGGVPLKDLLQLGFSFFVAGYLLVKDWKLSSRVTTLLEKQSEILGRMERIIERVYERQMSNE